MGSHKKDVIDLIRRLRAAGWVCEKTRNQHWKCTPPGGGKPAIGASTPSDIRGLKNFKAQLRRAGWDG